ncbi:hypothetical protein [Sphingobium lignivorans]|uniref:Uncharacterized protein n=1 Tax=Sphingobium lignivorans TaxID=2735886 RepID=A0ABR6NKJ2_9SPHN|nr:hypothetical protein [Sphingobium lignivorans]MBB5987793.1 hypothetical protein [Sphingobium lignivorans]
MRARRADRGAAGPDDCGDKACRPACGADLFAAVASSDCAILSQRYERM